MPSTLSLTVDGAASFGAFTPGEARDYETALTATVTSTAGDATLSVVDPSSTAPGRLVNERRPSVTGPGRKLDSAVKVR